MCAVIFISFASATRTRRISPVFRFARTSSNHFAFNNNAARILLLSWPCYILLLLSYVAAREPVRLHARLPCAVVGPAESRNFFSVLVFTRGFPVKVSEPLHNYTMFPVCRAYLITLEARANDVRKIKMTFNKTFTSLYVYSARNRKTCYCPRRRRRRIVVRMIIIQMSANFPPSIYGLLSFVDHTFCRR